jgi:hypothetical protein
MTPQARNILMAVGTLFARYSVAIIVGLFISPLVFLFVVFILEAADLDSCLWIPPAVTGFVGVFTSSFLIPRSSRWIASLFLLGLGVGFYAWLWRQTEYARLEPHPSEFPHFIPLLCGGLVAVVIHFVWWLRRRPNTALEPTPTAP